MTDAATRADTTETICRIWRDLLAIRVAPDDDFFDLGGYSLLVPTVVDEARREGLPLTSGDLFTYRTPAALAAALERVQAEGAARTVPTAPDFGTVWRGSRPATEPGQGGGLVQLADGAGTPIFCFHWDLGNIRFMRGLVDAFRCNRPVFGTEARGLWDRHRPSLSVVDAARHHLAQIRAVCPSGPYLFLGLCTGGRIAYEAARQLGTDGVPVAALVLVNTRAPGQPELDPGWGLRERYDFRLDVLRNWFAMPDLGATHQRLVERMAAEAWLDEGMVPADLYWRQVVWAMESFAQDHYPPLRFDGALTLVQSAGHRLDEQWHGVAASVTSHTAAAAGTLPLLRDKSVAAILRKEFTGVPD
ncbi:thioesterase domain-containing protein [Micromonospora sp. NPDC007230]|uniref:thioesterase domain-containing protein n=1 Tax=Micromonospora sp. NPDC007230 TaxID=3364237 RepID=UPI0036A0A6A5